MGRELTARELMGKKTTNLKGGAGKYYAWTGTGNHTNR